MSTIRVSWYHSILRVSAVILAITLVFDSGLFSPVTAEMSRATQSYLANAVGVTVGVEPNELNVITARLTEQEQELAAREAQLEQRELALGIDRETGTASTDTNFSTYLIAALLFILLLLMVLNYAMDFARARRLEEAIS